MTTGPTRLDGFAHVLRPGWRIRPHRWRRQSDELAKNVGRRTLIVRPAPCSDCWNFFMGDELIPGRHRTPQEAMEAAELSGGPDVPSKPAAAPPAPVERRPAAIDAPKPQAPQGSAPMALAGQPLASIPWSHEKDVYIGSASPAELTEALLAVARAYGGAFTAAALARGLAVEIGGTPEETAILRQQSANAARPASKLAHPMLVLAQKVQAAALPWKEIIRAGAAHAVAGTSPPLAPDAGEKLANRVLAQLEHLIRSEAAGETADQFVARIAGRAPNNLLV